MSDSNLAKVAAGLCGRLCLSCKIIYETDGKPTPCQSRGGGLCWEMEGAVEAIKEAGGSVPAWILEQGKKEQK